MVSQPELVTLLEQANIRLGELIAFSTIVPDVNTFLRMHMIKEATQSSRIEGTQTTMREALMQVGEIDPEKKTGYRRNRIFIFEQYLQLFER